ncbi:hypothetical protein IQ07DRAFT_656938 [Pyrenochaeta sp. DS3sAY3a]|nr:hypothetical protein IQ07DRAFT_656938 [Pyrenochaeta sp. DS3sAY3a]
MPATPLTDVERLVEIFKVTPPGTAEFSSHPPQSNSINTADPIPFGTFAEQAVIPLIIQSGVVKNKNEIGRSDEDAHHLSLWLIQELSTRLNYFLQAEFEVNFPGMPAPPVIYEMDLETVPTRVRPQAEWCCKEPQRYIALRYYAPLLHSLGEIYLNSHLSIHNFLELVYETKCRVGALIAAKTLTGHVSVLGQQADDQNTSALEQRANIPHGPSYSSLERVNSELHEYRDAQRLRAATDSTPPERLRALSDPLAHHIPLTNFYREIDPENHAQTHAISWAVGPSLEMILDAQPHASDPEAVPQTVVEQQLDPIELLTAEEEQRFKSELEPYYAQLAPLSHGNVSQNTEVEDQEKLKLDYILGYTEYDGSDAPRPSQ